MIKIFNIVTGLEIIAEFSEENDKEYKVVNPLVVTIVNGPQGPGISFQPISMIAEIGSNEVSIKKAHLLFDPLDPYAEVKELYEQQFSSIIVPKNEGIIIP